MENNNYRKNMLLKSADEITKVSEVSLKEYVDNMEILAAKMNEVMLKRRDILELIGGEKNITMMKDNHNNHLRFIASILQTPNSETLVDSILWVFRAYMSRGFSSNYWSAQLNTWVQIMRETLSQKTVLEIISIYNWMIVNIPVFTTAADEKLEKLENVPTH